MALLLTIIFFLNNWQYYSMWYIFAFFVGPVSMCEAVVIASTTLFGYRKY